MPAQTRFIVQFKISQMTTEQLLIPRVQVVAVWFGMPDDIHVGDVLIKDTRFFMTYKHEKIGHLSEKEIVKCPHLFKPLHWWELRELSDMPMYLRNNTLGFIVKASSYFSDNFEKFTSDDLDGTDHTCRYTPATESEYNEYISQFKTT